MNNLVPYIKARYPVIYLNSSEEVRLEWHIIEAAQACGFNINIWSHTCGFVDGNSKTVANAIKDPIEALEYIINSKEKKMIYVFRDLPLFFKGPPMILRLIRDIARLFKDKNVNKSLIITSPIYDVPKVIERDITVIDFELPTRKELENVFYSIYQGENKKKIGELSDDEQERIIQATMGLTTVEAEDSIAKALINWSIDKHEKSISSYVMKEKASVVKKSGVLEYFEASETVNDIGGLDNLKMWLNIRSKSFTKVARDYGLPIPRGILLAGLPGTGKSVSAKATSNILGIPLIKFDVGRVFGSLVGDSEKNMRNVIQTVDAVNNCVLWIDELDKAFAGMLSGGSGDSGTSQRVFGNFITWMQEKKSAVFVVATVNRINGLPAELLRKGRFDEIFFVGLPSDKEREEILKIHIKKYGRDPNKFNLKNCIKNSDGFSGAELEEAVKSGLYNSFYHNRDLETDDILSAIKNTNALSVSKSEQLSEMIEWASSNAVNASTNVSNNQAGRQLDF